MKLVKEMEDGTPPPKARKKKVIYCPTEASNTAEWTVHTSLTSYTCVTILNDYKSLYHSHTEICYSLHRRFLYVRSTQICFGCTCTLHGTYMYAYTVSERYYPSDWGWDVAILFGDALDITVSNVKVAISSCSLLNKNLSFAEAL